MSVTQPADKELVRLHRRACTDMAARMRLPRWDQLDARLRAPLDDRLVRDLLGRVVEGNLEFAADLSGQPIPAAVDVGDNPIAAVTESIRTILTVVSGLETSAGFAPTRRDQFWARIAELTVLGYDLQQAIFAGAGLDDILIDRLLGVGPGDLRVWPDLEPCEPAEMTPEDVVLARFGRNRGLQLVPEDNCAIGQC